MAQRADRSILSAPEIQYMRRSESSESRSSSILFGFGSFDHGNMRKTTHAFIEWFHHLNEYHRWKMSAKPEGTYFFLRTDTNDAQGFVVFQRITFALLPNVKCPRKFGIEIFRPLRARWVSGGEFGNLRLTFAMISRSPEVNRLTNIVARLP